LDGGADGAVAELLASRAALAQAVLSAEREKFEQRGDVAVDLLLQAGGALAQLAAAGFPAPGVRSPLS
jgi:hypothetical protein